MMFRIYVDENNTPRIEEIDPLPRPPRDKKGKSLLESLSSYVVIDLETTGLDPFCDCIIEVAGLRVVDGVITEQFHSLVNPGITSIEYGIPSFITELTGITNEMLLVAPHALEILPKYIKFINNETIVAHNANFDVNFLYDKCTTMKLHDFSNNFIDTMRVSRRLFKEHRHHRLVDLIERFGIGDNIEHRALSDAIKTQQCYEYMKRHAVDNGILFETLYPKKSNFNAYAKNITTENTVFNEESPIYGNVFVFTGALGKMVRKEAMQLVVDLGGKCGDGVTKNTNFLVLGNSDYSVILKGKKSSKQKKAEKMILSGFNIEIISENVFYEMVLM